MTQELKKALIGCIAKDVLKIQGDPELTFDPQTGEYKKAGKPVFHIWFANGTVKTGIVFAFLTDSRWQVPRSYESIVEFVEGLGFEFEKTTMRG